VIIPTSIRSYRAHLAKGLVDTSIIKIWAVPVVLGVLGGSTWLSGGFWAPDGAYSRLIWPALGLLWVVVVSGFLLRQRPSARAEW